MPHGTTSTSGTTRPTPRSTARPQHRPAAARTTYGRRPAPRPTGPDPLEQLFTASAEAFDATAELPSFHDLGLPQPLVTALERRGMHAPFAIQARVMPDALAGRDVLGRAQTGSGKTLGFGLPMLTRLAGGTRESRRPRGLVLVPTRELANQVRDALGPLGHALDLRLGVVVGGAPYSRQIEQLRRGVDVLVATPGRLIDLLDRGEVRLDAVEVTVLDEADYMADLGFLPAVTQILDLTPAGTQRLLFSATLDSGVRRLVTAYLRDPAAHAVADATSHVENMEHRAYVVRPHEKLAVLAEIAQRPARTLFFARTKQGAQRLADQLVEAGVPATAIHGDLPQGARQRALGAFAAGRSRVLVATDVAARGIHVDELDLVVHVDPPADHKDYLHRSGRTARAGTAGVVLSILLPGQRRTAAQLFDRAGVEADMRYVAPGDELVRELAESGEPVVVKEEPRRSSGPRRSGPRRPGGRYRGERSDRGERGERSEHRGPRRPRADAA
ncbi:DEAD/DEAH box helicase [Vallicoccus soli]|uniref:DEAD/DEAH box helicase n=1 Tax=Vallicoccus soli TaxID=2339232 RepID=A0A3A3Z2W5_9ACTN|nr:DEAD/DEAH box helicase [Vallicoccus soli]RJK97054.1 DEAD/DEAH box helicase [Vallicoccus soli]